MKNIIKSGLAVTTIVAVGGTMLVMSPNETKTELSVPEVEADIGSYFGVDKASEFTYAMAEAGMKPRPFNLNGNTMFFGHTYSQKQPRELVNSFGDYLVEQGVNKEKHTVGLFTSALTTDMNSPSTRARFSQEAVDRSRAALAGDVVPIEVTDDYVSMSGLMLGDGDVVERLQSKKLTPTKTPTKDMMNGYRFLEFQKDGPSRTLITAVWTDDKFSGHKMDNTHFKKEPGDLDVPACLGCERTISFEPLSGDEPYKLNKYEGNTTPEVNRAFYEQTMKNRGWKVSRTQKFIDKAKPYFVELRNLDGKFLSMERNGQHVEIAFVPRPTGGTAVFALQSKRGGSMVQTPLNDKIRDEK